MSTLHLRFQVADKVLLDRALPRIAIELDDWTPALEASSDIIYAEISHQFSAQGQPPWAPLSRSYAARKARKFPGKPLLRATDGLYESLTIPGAAGNVHQITKDTLVIGSSLMVGKWNLGLLHDKGAPNASLPARPIMRFRREARTAIVDAHRKHMMAVAKAQGVQVQ